MRRVLGRRIRVQPLAMLGLIAAGEYLSPWPLAGRAVAFLAAGVVTARFVADSVRHLRLAARVPSLLAARALELGLTLAALALLVSKAMVWRLQLEDPAAAAQLDAAYRQYTAAFLLAAGLRFALGGLSVRRTLHRLELRPAQTVALGFALTTLAGTLLLSLPLSVVRLERLSMLDALFTATSAVTVTGLVVYDPAVELTAMGRGLLLGLIQLGGLGTMAASASLVVLAGRRLRLKRAAALQEAMDLETVGQVRGRLQTIVVLTGACEAAGAALLYLLWHGHPGVDSPGFAAVFHAVSAFCNAGFSSFSRGLVPFRDEPATVTVMAALIVVGGLGFPVVDNLRTVLPALRDPRRRPALSLHARLALLTSGVLLAGGGALMLALEWGQALGRAPWWSRPLNALFLSATARTAGFTTVDVLTLAPATLWVLMLLMVIGGSPGSTAGGIKTTTAATVAAALWSTLRGRQRAEAFSRTVPDEQVAKALALVGVSFGTIAAGTTLLLVLQPGEPLALLFEAVSAFGTVGLSTGVTWTLNAWGKGVIIALMLIGRTGPLTLGFALAARAQRPHVTYPAEKVMIG